MVSSTLLITFLALTEGQRGPLNHAPPLDTQVTMVCKDAGYDPPLPDSGIDKNDCIKYCQDKCEGQSIVGGKGKFILPCQKNSDYAGCYFKLNYQYVIQALQCANTDSSLVLTIPGAEVARVKNNNTIINATTVFPIAVSMWSVNAVIMSPYPKNNNDCSKVTMKVFRRGLPVKATVDKDKGTSTVDLAPLITSKWASSAIYVHANFSSKDNGNVTYPDPKGATLDITVNYQPAIDSIYNPDCTDVNFFNNKTCFACKKVPGCHTCYPLGGDPMLSWVCGVSNTVCRQKAFGTTGKNDSCRHKLPKPSSGQGVLVNSAGRLIAFLLMIYAVFW